MTRRHWLIIILVGALIGFALSTYSFAHNRSFVAGTFCTINATFDCDVVNKGPYSQLMGVPVAVIGMIGYAFLVAGSILAMRKPDDRGIALFLLLAALGGLAFSLYLTSVEAFILHVWCVICLTSQAVILVITAAAFAVWRKPSQNSAVPPPAS